MNTMLTGLVSGPSIGAGVFEMLRDVVKCYGMLSFRFFAYAPVFIALLLLGPQSRLGGKLPIV